jgi:Arm DNA-binding domain
MAFVHRYERGGVAGFPFTIGTYPEMSLEEAHEIHAANRRLLARGIDPKDERERLCHGQEGREAELVLRNESGRIDGVHYDELAPMLLNEVQQQQRKIDAQAHINAAQAAQLRDVQQKLGNLQVALTKLQAKDELVATADASPCRVLPA